MAWARRGENFFGEQADTTVAITADWSVEIGDVMAVYFEYNGWTATATNVSDQAGNTWSRIPTALIESGAMGLCDGYYTICTNARATSDDITITFDNNANYIDVIVVGYYGNTAALDGKATDDSDHSASEVPTISYTPTEAGCLGIAFSAHSQNQTAVSGDWTSVLMTGWANYIAAAEKLNLGTGAQTCAWNVNATSWGTALIAFKVSGGAPAAVSVAYTINGAQIV